MSRPTRRHDEDGLARELALLMRIGTAACAALLGLGLLLLPATGAVARRFLLVGCAALVLLPVIKLVLMVRCYAGIDRRFAALGVVVLALVAAGAAVGVWH